MLDCFDQEFHKKHTIKTLTVSYNAQSKYGDEIQLSKGIEKEIPLTHYIEAKNLNNDKKVFQSLIGWN
jgi:acyl-ACP thioesterase